MKIKKAGFVFGAADDRSEAIIDSLDVFLSESEYTFDHIEFADSLKYELKKYDDSCLDCAVFGNIGDLISFEIDPCEPFSSNGGLIDYIARKASTSLEWCPLAISIKSNSGKHMLCECRLVWRG